MFVFKILLIILIALPVIALSTYLYSQMLSYIKAKNSLEDEAIRQSVAEAKAEKGKKSKKNRKKEESR